MKRKSIKLTLSLILILIASCDEPETVVTNYVYPDGSVLRKIEMRNLKNNFKKSALPIPFDSTWSVKDTIEISPKGDTTWIKRAEKLFKNIDGINLSYKTDSGANKDANRYAGFKKSFKWFNTEFRFSERIEKTMSFGYPVKDFLNSEELQFFYSPESLKHEKETGPDSLKYKALSESVKNKVDTWAIRNLVSEWIGKFSDLISDKAGKDVTRELLKAQEEKFGKIFQEHEEKFDSLWSNDYFLKKFIGEANAMKYKAEADSAMNIATYKFFFSFNDYSVHIVMPGKLIGTNGFIDSSKALLWPVKSDFFLTEPYEMWAESKIPNRWAWIVSGLFLVFVLSGVIIKIIKKD
jgi:hypothetical protein